MNLKPVFKFESENAGMLVNQERAGACVSLANFQFPSAGEELYQAVCIHVYLSAVCIYMWCQ